MSSSLNASNPTAPVIENVNSHKLDTREVAYAWMCVWTSSCNSNNLASNANTWTVILWSNGELDLAVQYCLSEPMEEHCQMQFSVTIMSIVIICNLLKAVCMLLALIRQRSQPLVTLGDAIQTFLQRADSAIAGICLADKSGFISRTWIPRPKAWNIRQRRWLSSAGMKRWLTYNILYVLQRKFNNINLKTNLNEL